MITLEKAHRVIAAGEAKAKEIGQPMNIAVVDAGTNLKALTRMDGAWLGSIDIAINKAFTAKAFDISTRELGENSQPGDQFYGIHVSNHARVMIFAGGIPLKVGGVIVVQSASAAAAAYRIKPWQRRRPPYAASLLSHLPPANCIPARLGAEAINAASRRP